MLDYLASLGGHMGEAYTTPSKPADCRPPVFFWAPSDQASLSLDPNKKPRTWGAGLLWACGQYWTRTSDLYHVKVAL